MFFIKLIHWFRGYIIIEINGWFTQRFMNLASKNGIKLWSGRRKGTNAYIARMNISDFCRIRGYARTAGVKISIKRKVGLPVIMQKYRRRYGILAGIIMFFVFIYFMSSFIWSVEISGNTRLDTAQIMLSLEHSGLKTGVSVLSADIESVKDRVMLELTDVAYITINIKGSKAFVDIREKDIPPQLFPVNEPCNIIAKHSGIITKMNIYVGNCLVGVGDAVRQGDILISGVMTGAHEDARFFHSDGEIYAQTIHVYKSQLPLQTIEKTLTGNTQSRYTLSIFGIDIPLYFGGVKYSKYDQTKHISELRVGEYYFPVSITKTEYTEYEDTVTEQSEGAARQAAKAEIAEYEKSDLADAQITEKKENLEIIDKICYFEVEYKCIESIGQQVAIQLNK